MSYTEIEALVKTKTPTTVREAIDGLEMMTPLFPRDLHGGILPLKLMLIQLLVT